MEFDINVAGLLARINGGNASSVDLNDCGRSHDLGYGHDNCFLINVSLISLRSRMTSPAGRRAMISRGDK